MIRWGLLSNMRFLGPSYIANFLVHNAWASSLVTICVHLIFKWARVAYYMLTPWLQELDDLNLGSSNNIRSWQFSPIGGPL